MRKHDREDIVLDFDTTSEELAAAILSRDDSPSRNRRKPKANKRVPASTP